MPSYSLATDADHTGQSEAWELTASASVRAAVTRAMQWTDQTTNGQAVVKIQRASAAGTGTAQTPEKLDIDSPAAAIAGLVTPSAAATQSGQPLVAMGEFLSANVLANWMDWTCHPRHPIIIDLSSILIGSTGTAQERWTVFWGEPERPRPTPRIARRGIRPGYDFEHSYASGMNGDPVSPRWASQFVRLNPGTWPESFVPPYSAAFFPALAAADNPGGSSLPNLSTGLYSPVVQGFGY